MSNKVISKYFSTKTGMDDSLSDFQEKKKYNTGPKNVKKPRNIKKPKRTRGQKDIRALIKNQENDVLSYSKDFNKICKQAGVDVDAEELQLAIALSKSHHDVKKENSSDIETNSTEHMTSQQRILKIKTSLQEYGFRVPKTKITETNKRKRFKKQYKLLLTSKTERQQIIFNKYSEVLAGNIFKSPTKVFECDYSDKELYYKATNIAYEHIKNDNLYYVTDLFHKSCHKNCLLRNWSEIPGRPLSPTVEVININFDDIICNQHELDCILSGTIFAAQQIVTNKNRDIIHNNTTTIDKTVQLGCQKSKPLKNEVGHVDNVSGLKLSTENFTLTETNCYTNSNTMSNSQLRSVSPDLFDDEVSAEMEFPDNDVQLSGQTLSKNDNIHTYCMDFTECVNIDLSDLHAKTKTNTNGINITNRKSNDLMEKTECVSSTSSKQINVENVNLTQSSNESNKQNDNVLYQNENIEIMDLTQVKDYDPMPEKINDTEKDYSLDKTVMLVDDDTTVLVYDSLKMQPQKQNLSIIDLPESICIDDINNGEDDSSIKNGKDQSSGNGFKDHFYNKSYESNCGYKSKLQNIGEVSEYVNELVEYQPGEIDLTQTSNSSLGEMLTNQLISNYSTSLGKRDNVSIDYDEINNICSESINSLKSDDCRYESYSLKKEANKSNKDIASNPNKTSKAFECLENESNYSIHQSKHYMNIDFRCTTFMNHEYSSPEKDACNANHDSASNPSKNSEVFEISDKEFNYSLHHSKQDNFDFRDVSVMNDFSHYKNHSVGESSHYSTTRTRSFSESNLQKENIISPVKEQSQSQKLNFNSEIFNVVTVPKQNTKNVLNTPKNGEFTIKTNEVTPMLDYASMSTPERHKELEKYGLKPFKRKRAIQLLTYVYNQTHPVVESHDDCPSPSKRKKKDEQDKKCSSPQKSSNSVPLDSINKISKASVEPIESIPKVNDLYAITTEQPDIRNIECDTEDWFFQKREKAKLYSCRVPLHVAFHNYVSCRRRLREAILRYEPVNIDVIHKDLVATGYRYNPKDLLKFMDRKCITVKTADNSRNRKL